LAYHRHFVGKMAEKVVRYRKEKTASVDDGDRRKNIKD